MGGHQFTDSAHMTGGARRSPVVPRLPGIRGGIPLPTVAFGIVDVAVFAVIENLNVGVIRTKVTGSTCRGFTGFDDAEAVTGVAGGTVSSTAIGVNVPHARIGPGGCERASFVIELDPRSMTLHTACFIGSIAQFRMIPAFVPLNQCMKTVFRDDLPVSPEMSACLELVRFIGMTTCAGGGRHQC